MSEELPVGWAMVTLADVAEVGLGKMLDKAKHTGGKLLPYLRNANVRWGCFDLSDLAQMHFEEDELEKFSLKKNDLIVCEGGEPGRAAIWASSQSGILYQKALLRVRPRGGNEPRWILLCLRHDAVRGRLLPYFSGTTIKHFPLQSARRYEFPLPPLKEQRRIVARLEKLEARLRRARTALEEIPDQLTQARRSLLAAAFRGELTAEMRKTPESGGTGTALAAKLEAVHEDAGGHARGNASEATEGVHDLTNADFPATWGLIDLRNLCPPEKPICYGILMPGPDRPDGIPYVRVADFPNDTINLKTVRRTTKDIDAKFARARLRAGDLLLSIRGSVGRLTTIPRELDGANITQDSARLSISPMIESKFVAYMLRAPQTQTRMQKAVKGVAVRGINIGDVRAIQVPIPPLAEQRKIVKQLARGLARLDAAAAAQAAAVADLDRLEQSLLAKAFRGDLVPQDPDDEPAAAMLARLADARSESTAERPARRRRQPC